MSEVEVREIWRRLDRLEAAEPTVVADRVSRLSTDMKNLEREVEALRKTLMGFLVTFAFFGITLVVSLATIFGASP